MPTTADTGPVDRPNQQRSRHGVPLTVACILLTAMVTSLLDRLSPADQLRWQQAISTDVWHLTHDPLWVLVASPWWSVIAPLWQWVLLLTLTLGPLERAAGWRVSLVVVACGHVAGTLVSEGTVAWQVHLGVLPHSAVHRVDVGISYVAAAAAGAGVVLADGWLRLPAALGALIVAVDLIDPAGVARLEVEAVGHTAAVAVGLGIAAAVLVRRHRATSRAPALAPPPTTP